MALGDYTPTAWVNGTTPAINATNLGHIETKVEELDTLAPKIWYSSSGTGGSDGNGEQPPAPKPRAAVGAGNMVRIVSAPNSSYTLPSGGSWVAVWWGNTQSAGTFATAVTVDFLSGGGIIPAVGTGVEIFGFAWRIAE